MLLSSAMNHHRSRSLSAARFRSPSWGSLRRRNRAYPLLEWFSLVLCLSVVLGTSVLDACGYGAGDSLYGVCAESVSFCFRSTLKGFGSPEEGNCQEPCFGARASGLSAEWRSGNAAAFKMADGGMASCRLVDTDGGLGDGLSSGLKNSGIDDVGSCMASLVPDSWTKTSSSMTADFVDRADAINSDILNGSSSLNIEINPPFLDWGEHSLFTPSIAFLTVKNTFDDSVLDVYEPYSTDPQFYSYGFEKLALVPGESASIPFVFLPRWLGSSAAHIVLQTSFGGFIIQARGVAVESPYKIEPLVGTDVPSSKRLTWNLSFYNPFSEAIHMEVVSAWVSLPGHRNQSVHVVCGLDPLQQPSAELDNILADDEWFRVESSKLGVRWLDIRPQNRWQVPAQETQLILEIRLWPYTQGNILGAICFKIRKFSDDKLDTVVLPLEINIHPKTNYSSSTDSVFVDIEPLQPCKEKETVLIISFRNDGLDLLSLMNISEVTKSSKLFKVRYMEGLLLFPGTSTKIAMISYADHVNSNCIASAIPGEHLECQLLIVTNGSASSVIKIPCLDLVHAFSSGEYSSGILASDDAYNDGRLSTDVERNNVNAIRTSLQGTSDASLSNKHRLLEAYEADEVILKNWRSQGTGTSASVLEEQELLFPVVPVGTHFSKWFSVHNPSQQTVMMQFLLNSGDIIDQCKSADELYDHTFSSRFTEIDSPETRIGFSIPDSAITEALLHPSESALFGPVIFRPSNRCMWRSSALIRNNLSGVEWFPVRAFGGSHLLIILEGSEAVWKLEFNFHLPINMSSANSLSHIKNTSSLCNHRLSKEIYAKNIGELPLEVKKLKVSGTDCGLDGFMLHRCKGFTLEPGESIRLLISYEADFSADVVHRDLELALATGIFVIPMKASIPLHMLNLCKKTFFQAVYWKVSLLAFVAVSTLLLLIRILPRFIFLDTEEYYVEVNNTTSKGAKSSGFQNTAKFSRLSKKDKIPQAEFLNNYHVGEHVFDNSEKVQEKQDFGQRKEIEPLPSALASKPVEVFDKYNMLETPQGGLTVRIKEKGRRRKRRITGTGLAGKLEVSSSQSGNSTPSSPLSPNAYTPKQAWPRSPESEDAQFAGLSPEQRHQKEHNADETMLTRTSEAAKHSQRASMMLSQKQSPSPKSTGKPTSTPPAKFPGSGWPAPTAAAPSVSAVHSPIAPYARAPGPKSGKDKSVEMNKNDGGGKELTYDIWGNYFSDNFLVRQRETPTKKLDASEGDSQSLFARDPQSLMMMPSAWPLPPGQNLPCDNVTHLNQMN